MAIQTMRSRQECVDLLGQHLPALQTCFETAWTRWIKWLGTLEGSPADVSPRSRASLLYDFIKAEVIRQFLGVPGVVAKEKRSLLTLKFGDMVVMRFKKFRSGTLRTSVNNTQQALAFDQQQFAFAAPLQPLTHLVAGYLLDELELNFQKLAVTCSIGGQHLWAPIEIIDTSSNIFSVKPPAAKPKRPVVRSKRKAEEKKPTSDEGKP